MAYSHDWNVSPREAIAVQEKIRQAVGVEPQLAVAFGTLDQRREAALRQFGGLIVGDVAHPLAEAGELVAPSQRLLDQMLPGLGQRRFDLAVIDEAAQCTEPACWLPLLRCERVVLAGDHSQLPPTILSREAAAAGKAVDQRRNEHRLAGA